MKNPLFLAALLFSIAQTAASQSQTFQVLQKLEGNWYLNDRRQLLVSEWRKTGENEMRNRVFTIICGDTTEVSRSTLFIENQDVVLSVLTDSLGISSPEKYLLEKPSDDETFQQFNNPNPNGIHQKIKMDFSGENFFTLTVVKNNGQTIVGDFRRYYERVTRLDLKIRAAANASTLSPGGSLYGRQTFEPRLGSEIMAAITFRSLEGPLQIGLELGATQRQTHVYSEVFKDGHRLSRDGTYHRMSFWASVVPEIFIGGERDWSILAGAYATFPIRNSFTGLAKNTGETVFGNPDAYKPEADVSNDFGLLFGFNRRFSNLKLVKLDPAFSFRMLFGNNDVDKLYGGNGHLRVRGASFGLVFRLRTF